MISSLWLHRRKLLFIGGLLLASVIASVVIGEAKRWQEIDWLDVVGEGGSAIALAVWLLLILASRPAGRVTDLLTLGLGFMFLALWQDSVDEFIRMPAEQWWDQWLESVAMPIGVALLTYGLFHWHSEQLSINQQLRKRERVFREHRFIDRLTQVGRVDYLKQQLSEYLDDRHHSPMVLLMVDINDFATVNRQFGHREGDRLLHEISEVLLLNMRDKDLICRYAGDRFAVLLPDTDVRQGRVVATELQLAVQYFAFRLKYSGESRYQRISIGISDCFERRRDVSADDIIDDALQSLAEKRHNGNSHKPLSA